MGGLHASIALLGRISRALGPLLYPAAMGAFKDSTHPPQELLVVCFAVLGPSLQPWLRQDATTAMQARTRLPLVPPAAPSVRQGPLVRPLGLRGMMLASSAGLEPMLQASGRQAHPSVNRAPQGNFQLHLGRFYAARVWTAPLEPSHPMMVHTALHALMGPFALEGLTRL